MSEPIVVATYDNPNTMARELWQNEKLIGHTQATVLLGRGFAGSRMWDFRFNVGEWEPGRVWGDLRAIAVEQRPQLD